VSLYAVVREGANVAITDFNNFCTAVTRYEFVTNIYVNIF